MDEWLHPIASVVVITNPYPKLDVDVAALCK